MNNNTRARKQILDGFLKNLFIISDKAYQKRIWIEGKGPEVHSYDEAVCDFFDLGETIFENYQGYSITEKQQELLMKFQDEFKRFTDENNWPQEFIDTPEWSRITEMAKEVLKVFNYQNKDQLL